jgi:hypothetical protein
MRHNEQLPRFPAAALTEVKSANSLVDFCSIKIDNYMGAAHRLALTNCGAR